VVEAPLVGFGSARTQLQLYAGFHLFPVLLPSTRLPKPNLDNSGLLWGGCSEIRNILRGSADRSQRSALTFYPKRLCKDRAG